jgi:hypothetical protein
VLNNRTFLIASPFDNEVASINFSSNPPTFNTSFTPPGKTADYRNDKEGWTLLPDCTVLTTEIWNSADNVNTPALIYTPSSLGPAMASLEDMRISDPLAASQKPMDAFAGLGDREWVSAAGNCARVSMVEGKLAQTLHLLDEIAEWASGLVNPEAFGRRTGRAAGFGC